MGDGCAVPSPVIPHPPFHQHHHQHPRHHHSSSLGGLPPLWHWLKKKKNSKKNSNIVGHSRPFCKFCFSGSMYIIMCKIFGQKILYTVAQILIKVTVLPNFYFLLLLVIFFCNKCGNRTRICC